MNSLQPCFNKEFRRTLVFAATYNERENIKDLLSDIWRVAPDTDVLIVDDNSPDGTGALLDEIASATPFLKVVHRPGKLGLGTAHHLAMIFAIKHGYNTLITMDADRSHDPRDIPRLLEKLSEVDFVIGSRYMTGGSCDYVGYRRYISVAATIAARLLLGISLHEFTTSYRAFRVSELSKVNFRKMHTQGYSFFMESIYRLNQAGLRLAEVPIHFGDRTAGVSKIPRFEIVRGISKLLHLTASRVMGRTMPPPMPLIEDTCANCGSDLLSERFPRRSNTVPDGDQSSAFRCSSMAHTSKPRVATCLQCSLSQVPCSEHPLELEDLYADVVDEDYLDNFPAKKKTFAHAFQRIQRFLPGPGRLLEVGSYCGLFLLEAGRRGWIVKGIEPSHWAAEYAKSTFGLNVIHGSLEKVASSSERDCENHDVVVSWDTIEHVSRPREHLDIVSSMLKPGGIFALSTIDIESWFSYLLGRRWPWIMEMHLFYFGSGSLERMLAETGFEVVCVEPYRHYISLRYAYRKLCAVCPEQIGKILVKIAKLAPKVIIPVTLGDVKLYVARKR